MPEGNVIHRFARDQNRDLAGRRVAASAAQRRFAREARRLDGRTFLTAEAYGKHLFHHFRGGPIVHVHLGMFGDFYRHEAPPPPPRPTVRLRLQTGEVAWDLIGPPTCEIATPEEREAILARLGPDPLDPRVDPSSFFERLAASSIPVGQALLDQRFLAGLGNIYRAEILYLNGLHPMIPSRALTERQRERLWETSRDALRRGLRNGRILTLRPEDASRDGARRFYVYGEERCLRCRGPISRLPLSGRTMYACERCQRRPAARRS